jgi:membrane-bound lytic murein transglycosylase A
MRLSWALAAAGLVLSACATTPPPKPIASHGAPPPADAPAPTPERPAPPPPAAAEPELRSLASLPGWRDEDHRGALAAFQAGCGAAREPAMRSVCAAARALGPVDADAARRFFETRFRAEPVGGGLGAEGVLTAYFAPVYEARSAPTAEFTAPVRPKPTRPVVVSTPTDPGDPIATVLARSEARGGRLEINPATADRNVIDSLPGDGALAWMRAEDLFFLQIQGSGVLTFPDGRRMKAVYVADNGKTFIPIARPMVEQGLLKGQNASGDAIRSWLADHRGPEAQAVMALNPRYIFFGLQPDDGREPAGAAGIPLPAGRSIAVDPSRHSYGELFWIDAAAPVLAGAHRTYRRMAVALDTGSAIRGEVRADLYIGRGPVAGAEAGRVRHTLRMTRLVPVAPEDQGSARHEAPAEARGG